MSTKTDSHISLNGVAGVSLKKVLGGFQCALDFDLFKESSVIEIAPLKTVSLKELRKSDDVRQLATGFSSMRIIAR